MFQSHLTNLAAVEKNSEKEDHDELKDFLGSMSLCVDLTERVTWMCLMFGFFSGTVRYSIIGHYSRPQSRLGIDQSEGMR